MTTLIDVRRLMERRVEELDRQKPRETVAAWQEHVRELAEAWKKPPRQPSSLAFLIQQPDIPIKVVAATLCRECESRRPVKPGGAHTRWLQSHYVVAWFVEWTLPRAECSADELISHYIRYINTWAVYRERPLDPAIG